MASVVPWSWSSLQSFETCPRRHYLTKISKEVVEPTTSALADQLGLAASTVSQHLSALVSAGVVQRHRAGTRVLYELNRSGVTLTQCLMNQ